MKINLLQQASRHTKHPRYSLRTQNNLQGATQLPKLSYN